MKPCSATRLRAASAMRIVAKRNNVGVLSAQVVHALEESRHAGSIDPHHRGARAAPRSSQYHANIRLESIVTDNLLVPSNQSDPTIETGKAYAHRHWNPERCLARSLPGLNAGSRLLQGS